MKYFLIIIILAKFSLASIIITEIMPNPIADESLNEWIEIYNNSTEKINLEDLTIKNNNYTTTIKGPYYNSKGTTIHPYQYAIITGYTTRTYNNFNVSSNALKLYAYPSLRNLKNTGATITIILSNKTSTITYTKTKEGKSISVINNNLNYTEPSPGYSNIKKEGCDWKINILTNQTINRTTFSIIISKIYGEKTNITLSRIITDSQNEIKKEYSPLIIKNILNRKTVKISPLMNVEGIYNITANISTSCDINPENNFVSEVFHIKDSKTHQRNSEIKIKNIYDLTNNKTLFGNSIRIALNIYKGDTDKKTIKLFIQKDNETITKQSKINLETKFSEIETTIPIQLPLNCNNKLENGTYDIIAKGLNTNSSKKLIIQANNNLCKNPKNKTITLTKDYPENKVVLKSKNEKIKDNILIVFSITLFITLAATLSKPL